MSDWTPYSVVKHLREYHAHRMPSAVSMGGGRFTPEMAVTLIQMDKDRAAVEAAWKLIEQYESARLALIAGENPPPNEWFEGDEEKPF